MIIESSCHFIEEAYFSLVSGSRVPSVSQVVDKAKELVAEEDLDITINSDEVIKFCNENKAALTCYGTVCNDAQSILFPDMADAGNLIGGVPLSLIDD